jgi:hypothetical protein
VNTVSAASTDTPGTAVTPRSPRGWPHHSVGSRRGFERNLLVRPHFRPAGASYITGAILTAPAVSSRSRRSRSVESGYEVSNADAARSGGPHRRVSAHNRIANKRAYESTTRSSFQRQTTSARFVVIVTSSPGTPGRSFYKGRNRVASVVRRVRESKAVEEIVYAERVF